MQRRMMVVLPVAALFLGGLVVAGCGSSSNSTSTETTTALTKAEYAKQGNAICNKGNQTGAKNAAALGKSPSHAEVEEFVTDSEVPNIQQQINGIAALQPPAAYQATAKQLITTAQAALDKLKANPALIESGELFAPTNKLASEIGLTSCASGS